MRRRIVLLTVFVSTVAILLFILPLGILAQRFYTRIEFAQLESRAHTVVDSISDQVRDGRVPPAWRLEGDDEVGFGLYSPDGPRLVGDGPPTADSAVQEAVQDEAVRDSEEGGHLIVAVPISEGDSIVGVVRSVTRSDEADARIVKRWLQMIGLAAAAVLTTWLLARYQARRLADPVEELSRAALRLGDGDFSVEERTVGIPEVDAVRSALNATAARLDALIARERAFSAEASHQLRTPLTGLQLRLEAALRNPGADHETSIRASLTEVDRLERTIADLLALARGNRPGGTLDLSALLTEVEQIWGPRLGSQGRTLRLHVEPDLAVVAASTAAIRQVFAVLLSNAVEHGSGTVTVTVRDIEEAVAIEITDEGDVADGPDVFERREPDADGHGIGLALARRLVEAEGGRLQLTRPAPTTLTMFLPVGATAPGEPPGPPDPPRP